MADVYPGMGVGKVRVNVFDPMFYWFIAWPEDVHVFAHPNCLPIARVLIDSSTDRYTVANSIAKYFVAYGLVERGLAGGILLQNFGDRDAPYSGSLYAHASDALTTPVAMGNPGETTRHLATTASLFNAAGLAECRAYADDIMPRIAARLLALGSDATPRWNFGEFEEFPGYNVAVWQPPGSSGVTSPTMTTDASLWGKPCGTWNAMLRDARAGTDGVADGELLGWKQLNMTTRNNQMIAAGNRVTDYNPNAPYTPSYYDFQSTNYDVFYRQKFNNHFGDIFDYALNYALGEPFRNTFPGGKYFEYGQKWADNPAYGFRDSRNMQHVTRYDAAYAHTEWGFDAHAPDFFIVNYSANAFGGVALGLVLPGESVDDFALRMFKAQADACGQSSRSSRPIFPYIGIVGQTIGVGGVSYTMSRYVFVELLKYLWSAYHVYEFALFNPFRSVAMHDETVSAINEFLAYVEANTPRFAGSWSQTQSDTPSAPAATGRNATPIHGSPAIIPSARTSRPGMLSSE